MTSAAGGWVVERERGRAQDLLDRSAALIGSTGAGRAGSVGLPGMPGLPGLPVRTVRVLEVDRPALILGSSQSLADVERAAAARAGVDVARRRSGGGAVVVSPGGAVWVDAVIPPGDPWWDDDVGRAAWPVGAAWAAAVEAVGAGPASVWRGPLQRTEWSDRVCLAGLGAGEVRVEGRKVVGVSQRRTRRGALFQTVGVLEWDPAQTLSLLGVTGPALAAAASSLSSLAAGIGAGRGDELQDALLAALMT